ncbi:MAG TPA: hypothetical protein VJ453_00815 [Terriglobales bacterium]|nr:hypothetical protein [Terriglobales bacterium]
MTLEALLSRLSPILERAQVPYMLTGSVASSAHGTPRSTRDVDIVIAPTREQLQSLMQQFPASRYYADEQQALQALENRSQFNVIDFASGWKVDFIIAEDSEYGRTALARRRVIDIAGNALYVASAEDVIIAKMQWAKLGGSDRQLQDAAGILSTQGSNLDVAYIERWVRELRLEDHWSDLG